MNLDKEDKGRGSRQRAHSIQGMFNRLHRHSNGNINDCIYFDCATRVSKIVDLQGGLDSGTASFSG